MKSRSKSKLGHMGSKTWSPGQIFKKNENTLEAVFLLDLHEYWSEWLSL